MDEERFNLRSLSPALCNLGLLLVVVVVIIIIIIIIIFIFFIKYFSLTIKILSTINSLKKNYSVKTLFTIPFV